MGTSISALQRNASAVVRKVAASGRAEEITDRGRVVALLTPPPAMTGLEKLRSQGLINPAEPGDWEEIFAALGPGAPGASDALREQRDTER